MAKRPDWLPTPQEWRACAGKRRYTDRGLAMKTGRSSLQSGRVPALWVYRCKLCKGWHLTRFDNGPDNAVH